MQQQAVRLGIGIYDFSRSPPSFNHLDFLLNLEKWRISSKLDGVRVNLVSGPRDGFRNDNLPPYGPGVRATWRDNIVKPMAILLPSCGEAATLDAPRDTTRPEFGRNQAQFGFKSLVDRARDGLYPFRAPEDAVAKARAKHGDRYITITVRDTGWWVHRTSNLEVWKQVAAECERLGFRAVFIPDGTKADTQIGDFACDSDAARYVIDRAALYAGSVMNFGIPNGPMWLCWFMGAPVMMCKMINEKEPSTAVESYRRSGLNPGSQMPNARRGQKLLWIGEDAASLVREFETVLAAQAA